MLKLKIFLQEALWCNQQGARLGQRDQFNSGFAIGLMGNHEQDTSHLCAPINLLIYLNCKVLGRALSLAFFVRYLAQ